MSQINCQSVDWATALRAADTALDTYAVSRAAMVQGDDGWSIIAVATPNGNDAVATNLGSNQTTNYMVHASSAWDGVVRDADGDQVARIGSADALRAVAIACLAKADPVKIPSSPKMTCQKVPPNVASHAITVLGATASTAQTATKSAMVSVAHWRVIALSITPGETSDFVAGNAIAFIWKTPVTPPTAYPGEAAPLGGLFVVLPTAKSLYDAEVVLYKDEALPWAWAARNKAIACLGN